jgi:hypothetical protein
MYVVMWLCLSRAVGALFHPNSWNCRTLIHVIETEHILQTCPKYSAPREVIWPEERALQTKLYGPRPELERTARFAKQTELDIQGD